jgi:CTP:molybdopterin cytidylyltransferase MocA
VLLAAGASRRMGRNKSLMRTKGDSFLAHGVRQLWHACDAVVVVLGSNSEHVKESVEQEFLKLVESGQLHADLVAAHRHGAAGLEAHFVDNPSWRSGMFGSVRVGLRAALRLSPDSVLVMPVDHPAVKAATIQALAAAMDAALSSYQGGRRAPAGRTPARRSAAPPFAYALVPRYRRHRGHPVALSPALARAVVADGQAHDLSDAVRRNARLVGYMDCADAGVVRNRNTPGD